jgi:hypothetical protein
MRNKLTIKVTRNAKPVPGIKVQIIDTAKIDGKNPKEITPTPITNSDGEVFIEEKDITEFKKKSTVSIYLWDGKEIIGGVGGNFFDLDGGIQEFKI